MFFSVSLLFFFPVCIYARKLLNFASTCWILYQIWGLINDCYSVAILSIELTHELFDAIAKCYFDSIFLYSFNPLSHLLCSSNCLGFFFVFSQPSRFLTYDRHSTTTIFRLIIATPFVPTHLWVKKNNNKLSHYNE